MYPSFSRGAIKGAKSVPVALCEHAVTLTQLARRESRASCVTASIFLRRRRAAIARASPVVAVSHRLAGSDQSEAASEPLD